MPIKIYLLIIAKKGKRKWRLWLRSPVCCCNKFFFSPPLPLARFIIIYFCGRRRCHHDPICNHCLSVSLHQCLMIHRFTIHHHIHIMAIHSASGSTLNSIHFYFSFSLGKLFTPLIHAFCEKL